MSALSCAAAIRAQCWIPSRTKDTTDTATVTASTRSSGVRSILSPIAPTQSDEWYNGEQRGEHEGHVRAIQDRGSGIDSAEDVSKEQRSGPAWQWD